MVFSFCAVSLSRCLLLSGRMATALRAPGLLERCAVLPPACSARLRVARRRAAVALAPAAARSLFSPGGDDDGEEEYTPTVDIALSTVKQGRRLGGGSFGDVYEGTVAGEAVVLKSARRTAQAWRRGGRACVPPQPVQPRRSPCLLRSHTPLRQALRFFRGEAAVLRRLRGNPGLPPFLGVAGADVYLARVPRASASAFARPSPPASLTPLSRHALPPPTLPSPPPPPPRQVWRDEGGRTLADALSRDRSSDLASLGAVLGARPGPPALRALAKGLLRAVRAVHSAGVVHRDVRPAQKRLLKVRHWWMTRPPKLVCLCPLFLSSVC